MDRTTPFQPWTAEESVNPVKSERELDDAKLHRENVNHPKHTQTASYDKESVAVASNVPGSSGIVVSASECRGQETKMDSAKVASMQQIVENTLSNEGRQRVSQLLEAVDALTSAERLLLYLRLPTGVPPHDPLKQPINPLGSRAELQQTVTWIQTHLEVDQDVSLPKQDVYDEYISHCMSINMKPLSTADFGKVMKQVYPTVRPRRLGTRGNSRYCYAGLRKKIKLEVPQLPDLGESSKELSIPPRENERVVCDWAESKLGISFANVSELSRHLLTAIAPQGPPSNSPPPLTQSHDDNTGRQLIKHLKRKIQTQATPGRPKKNKAPEAGASPPSTSYAHAHPHPHALTHAHAHTPVKQEADPYGYPPYVPAYYGPPRAHDYPPEYSYDQPYVRDLSVTPAPPPPPTALPPAPPAPPPAPTPVAAHPPVDVAAHNVPINLSSDWARRRPPEPPPARLPLPGKKLILETYQSETQRHEPRPPPDDFPRAELAYLPKKMRAAEIMGGKLAARHAADAAAAAAAATAATAASASAVSTAEPVARTAFLEDPKNLTSRSKSTAAALAREEEEAASPPRAKAPTPRAGAAAAGAGAYRRRRARRDSPSRAPSPDSCCGLDGINMKTGMICEEKHSEILNRERVISICNIDKHALDDYLNEGSQEHEEELLQYFQPKQNESEVPAEAPAAPSENAVPFLGPGPDPHDDHSQGKNEKISQLRELLAKNLKNQNNNLQNIPMGQPALQLEEYSQDQSHKTIVNESAFKPLMGSDGLSNGSTMVSNPTSVINSKVCNVPTENGTAPTFVPDNSTQDMQTNPNLGRVPVYNGHSHNEPQSPTTRTQQYDFVPISDGCQSPGNFHSKSPVGFGQRSQSPTKVNKPTMSSSLQTSPISHSTAASPFVSPRNTPVPRSKLCPRPIPKLNGRKRRNPLSIGVNEHSPKPFVIPNDQKFMGKATMICGPNKFCQSMLPMSAPPSPNILSSQYKTHMFHCAPNLPNGVHNLNLNFLHNVPTRDSMNGELTQPLSADPLSSEVSQFFPEPFNYRPGQESFRSQSVPLKQGIHNMGLLSYNNTPVGSVPPTPVPNEFCDFGSLADTCDISKAGLNSETLDKIYNAIDSSNVVLNANPVPALLDTNGDPFPDQPILSDEQLSSFIPSGDGLLDRSNQFSQNFHNGAATTETVDDFLKRPNSIEFDLSELETEKHKYYTSRSVPSTPLPFKRAANSQINSSRSRELFAAEAYSNVQNGISSKSVPSTPQMVEDRSMFSYSNRDYLINGNSVCGTAQLHEIVMDNEQSLSTSPLNDILREDIMTPLTPALLADLDKMDTPYVDL